MKVDHPQHDEDPENDGSGEEHEYSFRVEEFISYHNGHNVSLEYKQTLQDAGRGHLC